MCRPGCEGKERKLMVDKVILQDPGTAGYYYLRLGGGCLHIKGIWVWRERERARERDSLYRRKKQFIQKSGGS